MEHVVGLDVSLKENPVCLEDSEGAVVARGVCSADADGVAEWRLFRDMHRRAKDEQEFL